ncbi:hypothetical protein BVC80_883g14 [Macleaya cordata]|uniref:Uncharacterized protein n=1 Tax=Macleaya cordata TaxID=56857 RepID=A0A200RD48_MACCD|nr:hypothetical protein BVC80_883g14 [Macleaya cordata]
MTAKDPSLSGCLINKGVDCAVGIPKGLSLHCVSIEVQHKRRDTEEFKFLSSWRDTTKKDYLLLLSALICFSYQPFSGVDPTGKGDEWNRRRADLQGRQGTEVEFFFATSGKDLFHTDLQGQLDQRRWLNPLNLENGQALSGMIGRKASVGGFSSPLSNPRAQPWTGGGNYQAGEQPQEKKKRGY